MLMTRCASSQNFSEISNSVVHAPQITRIKEKVEEQSGVPPPQQRLIFGGRQLCVFLSPFMRART